MNNNTTTWAVEVGTSELSEAIQRIAFSFGYGWPDGAGVKYTFGQYLIFNPELKLIHYSNNRSVVESCLCKIVITFDEIVKLFKEPPVKNWVHVDRTVITKNGDVKPIPSVTIDSAHFDKLVEARNKLMGKEEKKRVAPVVRFRYESPTSGQKLRKLMVLEDTRDCYSGLDMEDGNLFKRFRKDRIVGAVMFVGFSEVKDY